MSNEGRIEFDILDHEGTCVIHYKFIGNWQPADFTPTALQVWDRVKAVPATEAIFSIMDFSLTPNFKQAGLVSEAIKAAKNPLAKRVRHTYMVGVKQKSFFESIDSKKDFCF